MNTLDTRTVCRSLDRSTAALSRMCTMLEEFRDFFLDKDELDPPLVRPGLVAEYTHLHNDVRNQVSAGRQLWADAMCMGKKALPLQRVRTRATDCAKLDREQNEYQKHLDEFKKESECFYTRAAEIDVRFCKFAYIIYKMPEFGRPRFDCDPQPENTRLGRLLARSEKLYRDMQALFAERHRERSVRRF